MFMRGALQWQRHYSTGIALVDRQHQAFFNLINQALNSYTAADRSKTLHDMGITLMDYHANHAQEEQFWKDACISHTACLEHQKQHQLFAKRLQILLEGDRQKTATENYEALLRFMMEWLITHLLDSDHYMAEASKEAINNASPQTTSQYTALISDLLLNMWQSDYRTTASLPGLDITRLLAGINHDLRTPLSAINSMIYLLRREGLSKSQSELVNHIELSCQDLLSLINDMVDLSKLQTSKLELNIHTIDSAAIIRQVCFNLGNKAKEKNINLYMNDIGHPPSSFKGDSTRIQQCLSALLNIAIKLTDNCSIHLSSSVVKQTKDASTLNFEILHKGNAIQVTTLMRLFQPSHTTQPELITKYNTNDLNLALSQALAKILSGEINVKNLANHETLIVFTTTLTNIH